MLALLVQGLLRRVGRDLLRAPGGAAGPDEQGTRQMLREVAAVIEAGREDWPPGWVRT